METQVARDAQETLKLTFDPEVVTSSALRDLGVVPPVRMREWALERVVLVEVALPWQQVLGAGGDGVDGSRDDSSAAVETVPGNGRHTFQLICNQVYRACTPT